MEPKILVSITGRKEKEWRSKLKEIEKLNIKECALFLELYDKEQHYKIYQALLESKIESIPLVHNSEAMGKNTCQIDRLRKPTIRTVGRITL